MKIRNLGLALVLATAFMAAQDAKKTDDKAVAKEATDPVCGMSVQTASAPKSEFKGKTYYFCSIDEKKEFDKAPASYITIEKKETTKK